MLTISVYLIVIISVLNENFKRRVRCIRCACWWWFKVGYPLKCWTTFFSFKCVRSTTHSLLVKSLMLSLYPPAGHVHSSVNNVLSCYFLRLSLAVTKLGESKRDEWPLQTNSVHSRRQQWLIETELMQFKVAPERIECVRWTDWVQNWIPWLPCLFLHCLFPWIRLVL